MTTITEQYRESTDPYILSDHDLAALLPDAPWRRVVGVGDSIVAGVREPLPGYRDLSWIDRLAVALEIAAPEPVVHNLGRRDLTAAQVRDTQLQQALDLRPDLALVVAGGNDLLRHGFDPAALEVQLLLLIAPLRDAGIDVVTMDLFDITISGYVPEQHRAAMSERLAQYVDVARAVAAELGTIHVRLRDHPAAIDPSIFSRDGLHLNVRGHAIVAAEVARALGAAAG